MFVAFVTTKPNGLGMGLSICRSIIEAHGGELWALSNDDAGSDLPVHAANPTEVGCMSKRSPDPVASAAEEPIVFVVDDDALDARGAQQPVPARSACGWSCSNPPLELLQRNCPT